MAKIGVIINPRAGKNSRYAEDFDTFKRLVNPTGAAVLSEAPEQLPEILHGFREREIDYIAFVGGDGTFQGITNAVITTYEKLGEAPPPLLPLGGGTINAVFKDIHGKGKPLSLLAHMATLLKRGETPAMVEREVLKVNGRYGFIFGAGFMARVTNYFYQHQGDGVRAIFRIFLRIVRGIIRKDPEVMGLFESAKASMCADGCTVDFDQFNFVYAATVRGTGTPMVVAPLAGERAGYFHAIAADIGYSEILPNIFPIFKGDLIKGEKVASLQARDFSMESPIPLPYVMDGELFTATDGILHIATGPRLTFLRPLRRPQSLNPKFQRPA